MYVWLNLSTVLSPYYLALLLLLPLSLLAPNTIQLLASPATSHHLFKKICWKMLVNLMTSIIGFMCRLAHSVQPIRLYPILMSILFHHYKQLSECISQVEQMTNKVEALQKGVSSDCDGEFFDFCKNT